ncbi:hypothetical protein BC829DRAFT_416745 [Chytridium lagenaria]|nr:hypothetical protein BC829DRAFT_416745 [Chytridium lagenaria]
MEGLNDASKNAPVSLDTPIVPYVTDVTVAPLPKVEERTKCRFFTSAKGCRLGSACRFLHIAKAVVDDSKALEGSKQELNPQEGRYGKGPTVEQKEGVKNECPNPFVIEKAASLANGESSETATSSTPHIKKVFNLKMVDGKMVAVEVVEPSKVVPSKKSQDKTTEPKATTETLKPTSRSNKKKKTGKIAAPPPQKPSEPASSASEPSILISTKALSQVPPPRVLPLPVQLRKRQPPVLKLNFSPSPVALKTTLTGQPNFRKLHDTPTTSTYHFQLTPTDPDFPFDLDHLSIDLNLLTSTLYLYLIHLFLDLPYAFATPMCLVTSQGE